jgi:acetyl-CoA carboxylase carboxyltransferase component
MNASPATLRSLADATTRQEAELRRGGTREGHERQRKLGRLPVRDRLSRLLDPDTPWLELNLWAGYEMYPTVGEIPAAGVVTGIGTVSGRACLIVANDATVKAGAFFPATVKKVLRAQRVAALCNLPLTYLVDSAGVYLPMQDEIFPDEDDFGRIFRNNAVLSAAGVPQLAAIMGNCVAGGAYLPVLCDKVLMTDGSELDLAGAALVKAAIGQDAAREDLGGAAMHAGVSGTVDFHEPNDEACLDRLRSLVALLPADAPSPITFPAPTGDADRLYDLVASDGRKEYDVREVLAAIVDGDSIQEYKAEYGKTLICAYAAVGGHQVGIVANQHVRTRSADHELQIPGVIYHASADKAARFVMDCNQTSLPILFFQDVLGFMVGKDSEQHGIIRSGAKLVNAVSNSTVPKITTILGGSFGAGNYALCGKAYDPTFIFAWPGARYAVMGGDQAAETIASIEHRAAERRGKKMTAQELAELRERIKTNYDRQMDIRYGAARGWVDAIIPPHLTRQTLVHALNLATRPPPRGGFRGGVMQV